MIFFWGGDHLIFRRTEGGITKNFGRIQNRGGPLKSAWTMPDMGGGGQKLLIVMSGDHFNEITSQGRSAKFHRV